jgi:hypothetical protein
MARRIIATSESYLIAWRKVFETVLKREESKGEA